LFYGKKKQIKKKTLLYYELESRLVVGIYNDILRVLGLDLGLSGNIKLIIIKCFVRQDFNFEGGGKGWGLHIIMWNYVVGKIGLINLLNIT
jgi:hypothetical protein